MKVLVTGFNPFGGETINPAYEAVKLLPDEIKGAQIIKIEIPTVFNKGAKVVEDAIEKYSPDAVLCVGQSGNKGYLAVERVGINLCAARKPDNEGVVPKEGPIREDGKNAYFATLPVKAMVEHIKSKGVPSFASYSAGTYVCNDVLYLLLYTLENKYPHIKGGFIHVPFAVEQAARKKQNVPCMAIETTAKGLEYAIEAIVENKQDIEANCGTMD